MPSGVTTRRERKTNEGWVTAPQYIRYTGQMRLAGLALLAACGSTAPTPDALMIPPTIDYRLFVGLDSTRGLAVWIDGAQTSDVHETYDRSQAGTTVRHTAELRYQDAVVLRREVSDTLSPCNADETNLVSFEDSLFALDSGDLRPGSTTLRGISWGCVGDGFGIAGCWQGTDRRCAPVIELAMPLFTRLDWVPAGPKLHGDACSFTPDPNGAYDDCAAGLFCYQGTCHTLCDNGQTIDGYAGEVLLCD